MVAKGKVFIGKDELAKLFRLPEGVEILAVRAKELDGSFEFLVVSNEETEVTNNLPSHIHQRMTHVPIYDTGGLISKGQLKLREDKEPNKSAKDIAEEISMNIRKLGYKA